MYAQKQQSDSVQRQEQDTQPSPAAQHLQRQVQLLPVEEQREALRPPAPTQLFTGSPVQTAQSQEDSESSVQLLEDETVQLQEGDQETTSEELTPEQCREYARNLEVAFGSKSASAGMPGAQALVDAALKVIEVHVQVWNERIEKAESLGKPIADSIRKVEEQASKAMGTQPTGRGGVSNAFIAGALPPEKVTNHLAKNTGTLRTKMTAIFNFITYLSNEMLGEVRRGDDTFFAKLGTHGETLKQTVMDAEARIQEQKRTNPKARDTILDTAKSTDTADQGNTRGNRSEVSDMSKAGTQNDPLRSKRKADDATTGEAMTQDELDFMGIASGELSGKYLTWREGLDLYLMKAEHDWVDKMNNLGLPIGAGPSGTTDRIMQTGAHLNCPAVGTRAASIAYLLPINAHTLVEIMTSAKPYDSGTFSEDVTSFAMYREIIPFGSLEQFDSSPDRIFWNQKVKAT